MPGSAADPSAGGLRSAGGFGPQAEALPSNSERRADLQRYGQLAFTTPSSN
jgi:hypothetical protein